MDEVCSVCGLPAYLSVDRCPYCGEKYRNCREINGLYSNERSIVNSVYNRIAMDAAAVPVNELRKLYELRDI